MIEDEVFALLRLSISSVWELELLLLLHRTPDREWSIEEIDREMRASRTVVESAAYKLVTEGLVVETHHDSFQYRPANPDLEAFVKGLALAFSVKPIAIIKTIAAGHNDRLRSFSDAFRLRD